jgi:sodium transport system permease protein
MRWTNVKLILAREIRDQLRDRRTMFMIFVLPVLLYPLLGVGLLRILPILQQKPVRVGILGGRSLPETPPLLNDNNRFAEKLLASLGKPDRAPQIELTSASEEPVDGDGMPNDPREAVRQDVLSGAIDAAFVFPPDFGARIDAFRQSLQQGTPPKEIPKPEILYSTARERSQTAHRHMQTVWHAWTKELVRSNFAAMKIPEAASEPVQCVNVDVAVEGGHRGAAVWSRLLPVLLVVWAMMGAFYPAVDLCAGEKERGTLETLLSSPAQRSEIVLGKLVTIMLFSAVTAVLNLACIMVVGWLILERLPEFGPPPLAGLAWLVAALVPASAMFGASCLALAAFARSSKEGQYYLMPLMMVTLPLAVLPATSGMELNLGSSLIPISGLTLLLRSAIEGNVWQVLQFLPPVLLVTFTLCVVAIRWAVDQFNSESVLFGESERLDLRLWMRHLVVDRGPTPTAAGAVSCGVIVLVACFFLSFAVPAPSGFYGVAKTAVVTQVLLIALPALLMTALLAGNVKETLLLRRPAWSVLAAAAGLAVVLQPALRGLQTAVLDLYPINPDVLKSLAGIEKAIAEAPTPAILLVMALLPAVCEEVAFRGFILSGLRWGGHTWRAIVLGAVFFGLTHTIVQQSLIATIVGVVIGVIAVRGGSLFPCMAFHFIHNALSATSQRWLPIVAAERSPLAGLFEHVDGEGPAFTRPVVIVSVLAGAAIVVWFLRRRPKESGQGRVEGDL